MSRFDIHIIIAYLFADIILGSCAIICVSDRINAQRRASRFCPSQFCFFKGIRHCFHSAREVRCPTVLLYFFVCGKCSTHACMQTRISSQVAATFGIPLARTDLAKRKREEIEDTMPPPPAEPRGFSDHHYNTAGMVPLPAILKSGGREPDQTHVRGRFSGGSYTMPKMDIGGSKKKAKSEPKKDSRGRSTARCANA